MISSGLHLSITSMSEKYLISNILNCTIKDDAISKHPEDCINVDRLWIGGEFRFDSFSHLELCRLNLSSIDRYCSVCVLQHSVYGFVATVSSSDTAYTNIYL